MERSILYKAQTTRNMELEYYIIIDDTHFGGCEGYGARIIKTEYGVKSEKCIESSQVNNIFYKRFDIEKFMEILVRNEVTPMSLKDITEDYIEDRLYGTAI